MKQQLIAFLVAVERIRYIHWYFSGISGGVVFMYVSEKRKFSSSKRSRFRLDSLIMMFVLGGFVQEFLTIHIGKLLTACVFGITGILVYWLTQRCIPRWVVLWDGEIRIGRMLCSFSEIDSILVERSGNSIRLLRKRQTAEK